MWTIQIPDAWYSSPHCTNITFKISLALFLSFLCNLKDSAIFPCLRRVLFNFWFILFLFKLFPDFCCPVDSGSSRIRTFRGCFGFVSLAWPDKEDPKIRNDFSRGSGGTAPLTGLRIHALFLSRSFLRHRRQGWSSWSGESALFFDESLLALSYRKNVKKNCIFAICWLSSVSTLFVGRTEC